MELVISRGPGLCSRYCYLGNRYQPYFVFPTADLVCLLLNSFSFRMVGVCQPGYPTWCFLFLWSHLEFNSPHNDFYYADGVLVTPTGQYLLYRSYPVAVLKAVGLHKNNWTIRLYFFAFVSSLGRLHFFPVCVIWGFIFSIAFWFSCLPFEAILLILVILQILVYM